MKNTTGTFRVVPCIDAESKAIAFSLRHKIFVEYLGYEAGVNGKECDEFDEKAMHFLMYDIATNTPIGCFRLVRGGTSHLKKMMGDNIGREDLELSRLILLPEWQGGQAVKEMFEFVSVYSDRKGIRALYAVMTKALSRCIRFGGYKVHQQSEFFELNGKRAVYRITQRDPVPVNCPTVYSEPEVALSAS